jgi:Polyphosphate kinase
LKLNNLVDRQLIKMLLKAEKAQVPIQLMIRGICSMALNLERTHLQGKALIDRYLEHTRIVKFHNKGQPLYFLGSADWMERNLDTRIEVMVPVYSKEIQSELEVFLVYHWNDTYSSFSLQEHIFNQPLNTGEEGQNRAQRDLYTWYASRLKEEA